MGLAVVHGIISGMKGVIDVQSEPGEGTTFKILLPAIKSEEDLSSITEKALVRGTERLLVVDDEPMLVDIVRRILQPLGYKLKVSMSPLEALDVFRSRPQDFDLVITDLTMPQLTGDKLAREITKIIPDMPIILCTGFSTPIPEEKARTMGIQAVLMKPIVMSELTEMVRKVLDGRKGTIDKT